MRVKNEVGGIFFCTVKVNSTQVILYRYVPRKTGGYQKKRGVSNCGLQSTVNEELGVLKQYMHVQYGIVTCRNGVSEHCRFIIHGRHW